MGKLKYFDCNCSIGRVARPVLFDIPDAQGLIKEMETAGIEEALVYHITARDGHPPLGNKLLIDEIRDNNRLYPVWVALPHYTREMPSPKELLKEINSNKVKAVRIYPTGGYHSFTIAEWGSGELLKALEEVRLPLILDIEIVSWEAVQSILEHHVNLPVIITDCGYRNDRFIYPLLQRYKNLYIEISRYMGAGGIEHLVKQFGAGNILFGANMPHCTGSAVVSLLTYAEITASDKEAIAGENLRNLLKGIQL